MSFDKRWGGPLKPLRRSRRWVKIAMVGLAASGIGFSFIAFAYFSQQSDPRREQLQWTVVQPDSQLALLAGTAPASKAEATDRLIYPYSVVPGGVRSSEGLRRAAQADPVVAEHYKQFNFARARVFNLPQPRLVFVSYRIGGQIYWTKKPVALRAGEKIISDGTMMTRTRCGNRISGSPQPAISRKEPAPEVMETSVPPPLPGAGLEPKFNSPAFNSLAEIPPTMPVLTAVSSLSTAIGGDLPGVGIPPILYGCNPSLEKCGSSSTPPTTAVPEPETYLQMVMAMGAVAGMWRKLKRPR